MILTHNKILEAVRDDSVRIEPFNKARVGAASIDFHLGNDFRRIVSAGHPVVIDDEKIDQDQYSEPMHIVDRETIVIHSGETILGVTKEKLTLPGNIAGRIEGRSRFARMGLSVHVTSGFIHPGTANVQVLEISNLSPNELVLRPGIAICQIVLERCEGEAIYSGKFQGQVSP